jgi:hypothetical protein
MATQPPTIHPTNGPIHTWFSLSYCNYQVLHRTLMQSMPIEWQERMVACLDELADAYQHIEQPEAFKVEAATEHIVNEMGEAQLIQAGIVAADWFRGEAPPEGLDAEDLAEWQEAHQAPEGPKYFRDGEELDGHERVLLPALDPVPHYRHAYIEPSVVIAANEIELESGDVMLQEMSVGDPIEIDKQTGPMRPGCWVIAGFETADRSRARVRRLTREEIEAARRGEAFSRIYE